MRAGGVILFSREYSLSADTDKELVRRVQAGDHAAFDLLFLRYRHKVHGLVSRYVSPPEDVDDVAQEAFIKAYRALPRFRGESAFYTWLYRIAVNSAKNHLASRSRRPPSLDIDADDADLGNIAEALKDEDDPEGALRQDELREAVAAAITALPGESAIGANS